MNALSLSLHAIRLIRGTLALGGVQQRFIILRVDNGSGTIQASSAISQAWHDNALVGQDIVDHADRQENIWMRVFYFGQSLSTRQGTDDMNDWNAPLVPVLY
jgi:hypothetical protein